MPAVKEIFDSGPFRQKLEAEISAIVRGHAARVLDAHDGMVNGSITSFRADRLRRSEPSLEEENLWSFSFNTLGTVTVGYVNSEGQSGESEIDAQANGNIKVILDFSAFAQVNFDMSTAVGDATIFVDLSSITASDADTKAGSTEPSKPKLRALEVAKFELIPEGVVDTCEFGSGEVRRILHNHEWYFSVVDVVAVLTDSNNPSRYWSKLRSQLIDKEGSTQLFAGIAQLKLPSVDGRSHKTDCASTETVLRLIQSVPSPKAEPMKRWLARVGYERIQETQNPEIAIKRAVVDYQLQGRTAEWIEARLRSILTRKILTDEWARRGIKQGYQFASLTDMISKAAFEKTTNEHRLFKGLSTAHSLRDNMTDMELILMSLGEAATREFARARDAKGFAENSQAAKAGGGVAGKTRKDLENQLGVSLVSKTNNLASSTPVMGLFEFPGQMEETMKEIAKLPPSSARKPKQKRRGVG